MSKIIDFIKANSGKIMAVLAAAAGLFVAVAALTPSETDDAIADTIRDLFPPVVEEPVE